MPDKRLEKGPDGDELTSAPITKPPQPLVIKVLNKGCLILSYHILREFIWFHPRSEKSLAKISVVQVIFFSDVKKFTCFFYTIL